MTPVKTASLIATIAVAVGFADIPEFFIHQLGQQCCWPLVFDCSFFNYFNT